MDKDIRETNARLARELEQNLRFGDSHLGAGWPTREKATTSYDVMLGIAPRGVPATILDVGCGLGHLLQRLRDSGRTELTYSGMDISPAYIEQARAKFPGTQFHVMDLLDAPGKVPQHDYCVLNGVFIYKGSESFDEMWRLCREGMLAANALVRKGFAINMMSKHVDWERDDLFHLPFETLSNFLDREISRRFTLRHDYGQFEFTAYVYKDPLRSGGKA